MPGHYGDVGGSVTEDGAAPSSTRVLSATPRNARGAVIVVALVLAALGPYVRGGIRTEQLGVYGLFLLMGLVALPAITRTSLRGATPWRLLMTWGLYVAIAGAASLGASSLPARWPQGDLLAGLDSLLSPLMTMLVVWLAVDPRRAEDWLRLAARLIAVAMAANGLLALVMTQVDLGGVLRPFWSLSSGTTTAEYAAGLGRFSGIFNHPAEGGALYGLAGVCAWYVWRHRPPLLYPVLVPILLGGLVTVSKIFVLGALPIILWLVWRSRGGSARLGLVLAGGVGMLALLRSGYADRWAGLSYLSRIVSSDGEDALTFFTAGRIGENSTLLQVVQEVARISPLFGMGAEGFSVPYDNGWVEAFVLAGLSGVACYTAMLAWLWLAGRSDPDPGRRLLLLSVTVLAAGGSLGLPVLTANRVATLYWLVCALAVAASRYAASTEASDGVGPGCAPELGEPSMSLTGTRVRRVWPRRWDEVAPARVRRAAVRS